MRRSDAVCMRCGWQRFASSVTPDGPGASASNPALDPPSKDRSRRLSVVDDVRREVRWVYLKSAIITAICLPAAMAIWGAMPGVNTPVWFELVKFLAMFVASFVVFFGCSLAWIGFDEPLRLEALRLLAVCSMAEIARAVLSPLPSDYRVQIFVQVVIGFVFVAGLMHLMEMEKEDAIGYYLISWGFRIAASLTLSYYAAQNGWLA